MIRLKITTHSGDEDTVKVESYEADELAEQINDNDKQAIALGDNIYSRIDVKNIKLLDKES